MTAVITTKGVKDGNNSLFFRPALDPSGTGAGPFSLADPVLSADGSHIVDFDALFAALGAALEANIALAASNNVIGRTIGAGPDYAASGVTPVPGTASIGTTAALTPKAGRASYLRLSGTGTCSGWLEVSDDGGTTWCQIVVEGNQLGLISYNGTNQMIPIPAFEEAEMQVRVNFQAVSGSVSYALRA